MSGAQLRDCRQKTLKCINCRPFLMAICTLVVIECACVLAELMIDLQGIKFRFENEETEIDRFVSYLRQRYPDVFMTEDMRTMADVINLLHRSIALRSPNDLLIYPNNCTCVCPCNATSPDGDRNGSAGVFESQSQAALETPLQPLIDESANSHLLSGLTEKHLSRTNKRHALFKPLLNLSVLTTQPTLAPPLSVLTTEPILAPPLSVPTSQSTLAPPLSVLTTEPILAPQSSLISSLEHSLPRSSLLMLFQASHPGSSKSAPHTAEVSLSPISPHTAEVSLSPISPHTAEVLLSPISPHTAEVSLSPISPHTAEVSLSPFSPHTDDLPLKTITDKLGLAYNLDTRKFDLNTKPLTVGVVGDQATKQLLTSDRKPGYTQLSPSSVIRHISDETVSASPQSTLLDQRELEDSLVTPSWSSKTVSLSSSKYMEISASPVSFFQSSTTSEKVGQDDQLEGDITVGGNSSFTHQPVITLSSQLLKNAHSFTDTTVLAPKPTLDVQSQSMNTIHDSSQVARHLSNLTPTQSASSNVNKTQASLPANAFTNISAGHGGAAPRQLGSMRPADVSTPPNDLDSLEPQQNMVGSSSAEDLLTTNVPAPQRQVSLQDIFILEINNVVDSFFLVAEFVPEHDNLNRTKFIENTMEYSNIYKTSKALHFISLSILSIMVLETAVKLFCTGHAFFKRKFEVFDAFIVVSSFALDFVFLDSRWYETGKDATTILVLLLPWRVVRIVNSFLMTMKHKHHLQMMNMKRAKKKAELKSAKLQTLLSEIRKDVQLLVALCRSNEIEEKDITACLYGKGRRSVTLSAMSTCTSLMLISTLGKDAVQEDDLYGKVFKEALHEGDAEIDAETLQAEEAAIDAAIELDEKLEARRKSRKYRSKKLRVKRSYTMPRRSASVEIPEPDINENSSNIFYINDGYFNTRGSTPRTSDIVVVGQAPSFPNKMTGVSAGCSSVKEEDEMQNNDLPSSRWRLAASKRGPDQSQARAGKSSIKRMPGKGSRSDSLRKYDASQVTYL